ncbi:MAG: S8 family serine peptidase [Longimicrobiales bacterium]
MVKTNRTIGLIILLAVMNGGCSDDPIRPNEKTAEPAVRFEASDLQAVPDVRAVEMDRPDAPLAWHTSAEALETAIQAVDGFAIVAFKEPESERVLDTGVRAAVSGATIELGLEMLDAQGITILYYFAFIGAAHVRLPRGTAAALRESPLVDYIAPRQTRTIQGHRATLSVRPLLSATFLTQTVPWGIEMVRAPEAWSVNTGAGAEIEIIDTGHDQGHEDLPYVESDHCAGAYGGCDDGPIWHGTHVLGIFTARDNTIGVVGVAPGVQAADVHVYGACDSSTSSEGCPSDEVVKGIEAGIFFDVINMSLGGTSYNTAEANAVAQAWQEGVVLVAAAGNRWSDENPPSNYYPAEYTNVVGVSGVRPDSTFAHSSPCPHPSEPGVTGASNYGDYVDLAAAFWALSTVGNDGYEGEDQGWCGTSMATPHVAGAAALLSAEYPEWGNEDIVNALLATASDQGVGGRDNYYGHGIADAARAIGVSDPPPPPAPTVSISGPAEIQPDATCTWDAYVTGGEPPYSYSWTNDGIGVSTGSSYTGGKDEGSLLDHFELELTVTDSNGAWEKDYLTVYEDESAWVCII